MYAMSAVMSMTPQLAILTMASPQEQNSKIFPKTLNVRCAGQTRDPSQSSKFGTYLLVAL